MPAQTLQTEGFVLTKRPAADPFEALLIFSAAQGTLHVLQRTATKPSTRRVSLDLFDEASLALESSNEGRTWFVREARLITRAQAIGRSYETLQAASAFTALIARNPVAPDSRLAVGDLLRATLAAFAASPRPDVVAFKALFRFARDEGHPVKQQWLPLLAAADRAAAERLLRLPLAELSEDAGTVARLQGALEEYLRGYTEISL